MSFDDEEPSQILPNLFLGSQESARKFPAQVLVSALTAEEYQRYKVNPPPTVEWHRFILDDDDTEPIGCMFESVHAILHSALLRGKRVLVHCAAGVSRSPTLVAAFLMLEKSWSRKQAIEWITRRRLFICPNDGFMQQLKDLEEEETPKTQQCLE
jgi:protein tyrosine phosphatase